MNHRICVAPMMKWTDKYARTLFRQMSTSVGLYTEMFGVESIIRGERDRFLKFDPIQHPVAVQLGGSKPDRLKLATSMCEEQGFDEINLNVGCPSGRVQMGGIGATMMSDPDLVASCVRSMMEGSDKTPVTVKTRTGVNDLDSFDYLRSFIDKVHMDGGCKTFIVHARKADLKGLNPKQNRMAPPLSYDKVYRLKQEFPNLEIVLNGGVLDMKSCQKHLDNGVDGVMIGRAFYANCYMLTEVDAMMGVDCVKTPPTRQEVFERYIDYCIPLLENPPLYAKKVKPVALLRHAYGLFNGCKFHKQLKRVVDQGSHKLLPLTELKKVALEAARQCVLDNSTVKKQADVVREASNSFASGERPTKTRKLDSTT